MAARCRCSEPLSIIARTANEGVESCVSENAQARSGTASSLADGVDPEVRSRRAAWTLRGPATSVRRVALAATYHRLGDDGVVSV